MSRGQYSSARVQVQGPGICSLLLGHGIRLHSDKDYNKGPEGVDKHRLHQQEEDADIRPDAVSSLPADQHGPGETV